MKFFTRNLLILTLTLILPSIVLAMDPAIRKKNQKNRSSKIYSEAGLNIPDWGVAIDAVYDPQLDELIPGYKIINVVVTNRGQSTIYLDPKKDKWSIKDSLGNTRNAINHLRFVNEKLWFTLPLGLREELEYPQLVKVGNTTKIDLFFLINTELNNFKEINWQSDYFKKEFVLKIMNEKNLEVDQKEEPIPQTSAQEQALQKYEVKEMPKKTPPPEKIPQFDPTLDDLVIPMGEEPNPGN